MEVNIWFWVLFNGFVAVMLFLDLFVFHRRAHRVTLREAAIQTAMWVSLALLFNVGLYFYAGRQVALEFLSGYLLEESLSVDNIFVFVLIFSYFRVPPEYQHRVLFWGILTAVVLRGTMILLGTALVTQFGFLLAIFGAFLVYTGIRMFSHDHSVSVDPETNIVVRLLRRFMPVTDHYHGTKFFIRENGRRVATPLLVVLILIETSDVIFAIDSIPAVLGITQDPFIVYTSNIFAILGLRALYFLVAGIIDRFHYLQQGLAVVLTFVGLKMLAETFIPIFTGHEFHMPIELSLGIIAATLIIAGVASILRPQPTTLEGPPHDPIELAEVLEGED